MECFIHMNRIWGRGLGEALIVISILLSMLLVLSFTPKIKPYLWVNSFVLLDSRPQNRRW